MKKRVLSLLLVVCMICTLLPVGTFASTTVNSGTCGSNLNPSVHNDANTSYDILYTYKAFLENNESNFTYYEFAGDKNPESYKKTSAFQITDMDNDGLPELITLHWDAGKQIGLYVWKYENGQMVQIGDEICCYFNAAGNYIIYLCEKGHLHTYFYVMNPINMEFVKEETVYYISGNTVVGKTPENCGCHLDYDSPDSQYFIENEPNERNVFFRKYSSNIKDNTSYIDKYKDILLTFPEEVSHYPTEYALYDVDKDGIPELIVRQNSYEYYVYSFDGTDVTASGVLHSMYYDCLYEYEGNGIVVHHGGMGYLHIEYADLYSMTDHRLEYSKNLISTEDPSIEIEDIYAYLNTLKPIYDYYYPVTDFSYLYNYETPTPAFNEYIYRADRMATAGTAEANSYNTLLSNMPCEIMAQAMEESGFRNSAEAWKALTTAIESSRKPGELFEGFLEEKDMFSAIILEALQDSTEFAIPRMVLKAESDAKEYWDIFAKTIKTEFNISSLDNLKLNDLTTKQLSELNDQVKENLKKRAPEFYDTDKFFDLMDDVADGITLLADYCEKIAAYSNLLKLENSMKEVVRQMYDAACENNADLPLKLALKDCVDVLNTGENALTFDIMMNVGVNGVLRYVVKELADSLWGSVMDAFELAHPAIAVAYAAYYTGKFVCNQLFSTDELVEKYFVMLATMECEQFAANTNRDLKSSYLSKKSVDSAKAYLDSVKLSFGFAYKDCDAAYAFCNTSDNAVLNKIQHAFGKANYSEVKAEIETLKSVLKDQQTLSEIAWVYSLDDDFPGSGLYEKYRARTDDTVLALKEKYHIACPVNVYVYDNEDKLVAYIEDGNVYAEGNVVAILMGDEKTFSFYDDKEYRIECVGYDSGTMDIRVEEYSDGRVDRSFNFNDIPVSKGKSFVTETDSAVVSCDGESISTDYDSASTNTVRVIGKISNGYFSSSEGVASEAEFAVGQPVTVTAVAPEGYEFVRWTSDCGDVFDDSTAISTTVTVPDKNFNISAEYKRTLSNPFVDVLEGSVYYDAILWAYNHTPEQITGGFDPTHFVPQNPCTRAQVVTFLWRAAGCPAPASSNNPFVDVSAKQANGKDNPYYTAILWAAGEGITNGTDDTHFSPNAEVTRAQFVTFLWRYENKPASTGNISIFDDANQIASPYQKAVAWAVERGITNGTDATHFSPNAVCTRWAVVLFMYRDMA